MRNIFAIIVILTFNLTVFGQHRLGLKANVGASRISNSLSAGNATTTVHLAPSGQAGLCYTFDLGKKSAVGAELLYVPISGREKTTFDILQNGNVAGQATSNIYKSISYLSLPLYYGFKIKRFTLSAGFQASFALQSRGRQKGQASVNGEVTAIDTKYDELNIDVFDFGPRLGLTYSLNDKIAIDGTYYYGVNNILASSGLQSTWRIQQATVGVRYTFLQTISKK